MNEDFVPFELLCKLREKGYYCKQPRYEGHIYDVLKWLKEKNKIFIAINIGYCYESYEKPFPTNPKMEPIFKGYYYGIWELENLNDKYALSKFFEAPKQAVLAGIEYVIDNLIQRK